MASHALSALFKNPSAARFPRFSAAVCFPSLPRVSALQAAQVAEQAAVPAAERVAVQAVVPVYEQAVCSYLKLYPDFRDVSDSAAPG